MREEGYIEVTGGRVWYQIFNKNSKATPVIILHGGPGSSSYSLEGLQALEKDRPVILYDQLGCGRSDRQVTLLFGSLIVLSKNLLKLEKLYN